MARGRPREFDEHAVLDRAMNLFWLRGYEATGLSELLEHMGISRQSLYDAFGNKRKLFLRSIEHYRATQLTQALALLEREGPALDNVKDVLSFFRDLALDSRCRGCFVANSLVEFGPQDDEVTALLQETLDLLRARIEETLERAKADGELDATKSPAQLARGLMNAIVGLAVTGRLKIDAEDVRAAYAGTLSMLA